MYGRKMTGDTSASGLYRKSYKTHYARVQRGQMSGDAFEIWKIQAQEKRDQTKAGELDMYDYEEWLKQDHCSFSAASRERLNSSSTCRTRSAICSAVGRTASMFAI
ncbi:MAG: hypothetical protein IJ123_04770 [Blautia sp.]|nr:hypothetical protein [Blautia sp.]